MLTQVDSAALHVLEDEKGQKPLAYTFKELQTIGGYNNAFMQLESGMVDAVACDLSIASYQMPPSPTLREAGRAGPRELRGGLQEGRHRAGPAGDRRAQALNEDGTVKTDVGVLIKVKQISCYGNDSYGACLAVT